MDRKPIWVVEITMPRKLVSDIYKGYMNRMREELGDDGMQTQPPTPLDTNAAMQTNTAPTAPMTGGMPGGQPGSVPGAPPAGAPMAA